MKKFISLLLALLLVMSLGSAAFAEVDRDASFGKTYKLENADTTSPAETFTFKFSNGQVTDAAEGTVAPEIPNSSVNFAVGEATSAGDTNNVAVALSAIDWPSVGIYTYDVTEVRGNTAGVTYSDQILKLKVTVAYDENTQTYYTAFVTMSLVDSEPDGQTDVKTGAFENTYSAGSLSVAKTVTGNMGDHSKYFAIKVTLTGEAGKTYAASYTVTGGTKLTDGTTDAATARISVDGQPRTFYLKHDETLTIHNLPYGVTYEVTEENYTGDGYTTTHAFSDDAKEIDSASDTVTITNNKQAAVDTGIVLDSLPYVLLLVLSIGGAVLFLLKRRSSRES